MPFKANMRTLLTSLIVFLQFKFLFSANTTLGKLEYYNIVRPSVNKLHYQGWFLYVIFFVHSAGNILPTFDEILCPNNITATKCLQVTFSNELIDLLVLNRLSTKSSIYEGYLADDTDVGVVMIENSNVNRLVSQF